MSLVAAFSKFTKTMLTAMLGGGISGLNHKFNSMELPWSNSKLCLWETFGRMQICWDHFGTWWNLPDAGEWGPVLLDGLHGSDHTSMFLSSGTPSRIPDDWKTTMETFFKDYEQQAGLNIRYHVPSFMIDRCL